MSDTPEIGSNWGSGGSPTVVSFAGDDGTGGKIPHLRIVLPSGVTLTEPQLDELRAMGKEVRVDYPGHGYDDVLVVGPEANFDPVEFVRKGFEEFATWRDAVVVTGTVIAAGANAIVDAPEHALERAAKKKIAAEFEIADKRDLWLYSRATRRGGKGELGFDDGNHLYVVSYAEYDHRIEFGKIKRSKKIGRD